ncbi:MAG: hypothetical protein J0H74_24875 [Chitinophagaceae bacterium]|nr:hypothetical protein [Chitinophagaceae bacterium]
MKWAVYILLMAALIYVGETIRMPFQLAEQQKIAMRCHQGKEQECPYRHQNGSSKGNDGKNGNCNPTANCSNCPLCYTAELSTTYTSAGISTTITKHYPEIPDQQLPDYTASAWKPPNA